MHTSLRTKLKPAVAAAAAGMLFCFVPHPSPAQSPRKPAVTFYKDVLPIFRTACMGCHSGAAPSGGVVITSFDTLMKHPKASSWITPGKGAESRLVKLLNGTAQPKMPPSGGGLKPADVEKIKLWIDAGASEGPQPALEPVKKAPGRAATAASTSAAAPAPPPGQPLAGILPEVTSLAWSDNGILAVGLFRTVQFWDTNSKTLKSTWKGHSDAVRALVYSRDGKRLAAAGGPGGSAGEVRIWNVEQNREERTFGADHPDSILSLAWSPDGTRIVTASADRSLKIWNTADGRLLSTLRDHADMVYGVSWSADGKLLVSAGADKQVKVWNAETGRRLYSLQPHEDVIYGVQISPNGARFCTVSADKQAKVFALGPEGSGHQRSFGGDGRPVQALAWASDSRRLAVGGGSSRVHIWNTDTGAEENTLKDIPDWVLSLAFSPDTRRLAVGTQDGRVALYTVETGKFEMLIGPPPPAK
jgi:Tol biopolymer transport system component